MELFSNITSLVFPEGYGKEQSTDVPMIGFQAIEIQANSSIAKLETNPLQEWVWLPVPIEGLSTSYENAWEKADVNIAAAAATAGISMLTGLFTGGGKNTERKSGYGESGRGKQASNAGAVELSSVGGAIGEFVKSKMGLGTGITKRMLEQSFISYSGPGYRSHEFSFALRPKSKTESKLIENIVLFFKRHSAPDLLGGVADVVRLYKTPHLFEIKFAPNKGLPFIAASACTNVGVKYGGEKYTTFADDDMPIQVDLSLSFKEMILHDSKSFPNVDEDF